VRVAGVWVKAATAEICNRIRSNKKFAWRTFRTVGLL
jgi:hypothetical protein